MTWSSRLVAGVLVPDLDAAIQAKLAAAYEIDVRYDYTDASDAMEQMREALLLVLNLHSPRSAGIVNKPHLAECVVCRDIGPEINSPAAYPCETVEAIATGLGISPTT